MCKKLLLKVEHDRKDLCFVQKEAPRTGDLGKVSTGIETLTP